MSVRLRHDRIVVKVRPKAHLPMNLISVDVGKTWAKEQLEAEVVGVGPDVSEVHPGDVLVITGAAGHWIDAGAWDPTDRDSMYRHMRESDAGILGVLISEKQGVPVHA